MIKKLLSSERNKKILLGLIIIIILILFYFNHLHNLYQEKYSQIDELGLSSELYPESKFFVSQSTLDEMQKLIDEKNLTIDSDIKKLNNFIDNNDIKLDYSLFDSSVEEYKYKSDTVDTYLNSIIDTYDFEIDSELDYGDKAEQITSLLTAKITNDLTAIKIDPLINIETNDSAKEYTNTLSTYKQKDLSKLNLNGLVTFSDNVTTLSSDVETLNSDFQEQAKAKAEAEAKAKAKADEEKNKTEEETANNQNNTTPPEQNTSSEPRYNICMYNSQSEAWDAGSNGQYDYVISECNGGKWKVEIQ